jgi:transposase-like protein
MIKAFPLTDRECVEMWRKQRWSQGVVCPSCRCRTAQRRSQAYREIIYRYQCPECGRWFNDLSGTPLQDSKKPLSVWFHFIQLACQCRSVSEVAAILGITYKTAWSMRERLRRLHEARGSWAVHLLSDLVAMLFVLPGHASDHARHARWIGPPETLYLFQYARFLDLPLECTIPIDFWIWIEFLKGTST